MYPTKYKIVLLEAVCEAPDSWHVSPSTDGLQGDFLRASVIHPALWTVLAEVCFTSMLHYALVSTVNWDISKPFVHLIYWQWRYLKPFLTKTIAFINIFFINTISCVFPYLFNYVVLLYTILNFLTW